MLNQGRVVATVAVSDSEKAKEFYGGTLGLEVSMVTRGGVAYTSGGGELFVYQSPTAGSGEATAANWIVDDIDAVVTELADKGIVFEHYEYPGAQLEGDVHVMGEMKAAWFRDPDGNILGISNRLS